MVDARLAGAWRRRLAGYRRRRLVRRLETSSAAPTGAARPAASGATHLGPVYDAEVERIRGQMAPAGVDVDYDLAYEHFDLAHFVLQVQPLLASPGFDPLRHFLGNGAQAKARPEVNFDTGAYLARHPERAHTAVSPYVAWLRHGRASGEVADPAPGLAELGPVLGLTEAGLADHLGSVRTDLQERLRHGELGRVFAAACEIEPLIGTAWAEMSRPVIPPFVGPTIAFQVAAVAGAQADAGHRRARVVIVAGDPRWGGGRRLEGHVAHALARRLDPAEIVVIYTDHTDQGHGRAPAGRFPDGVREIDLASRVEGLEQAPASRVLVELVRSLRAAVVLNVNSMLLHRSTAVYGRALCASERLVPVFFGNEQLVLGNWVGTPLRFFYRVIELAEQVVTDSEHLARWLRERHQLTPEQAARVVVLQAPVDPDAPCVAAPRREPGRRPRIYWAGRLDRQKRFDLAVAVAGLMPEVDLHVWGESVLSRRGVGPVPDNVVLHGPYARFADLDLAAADAWLYTSAWDGVPSLLLEVGTSGVPLVASRVGGTGEVLDDDDSWPVDAIDDPAAYVAALRAVLADPDGARARAVAMRERLLRERSPRAYAEQVDDLLGALLERERP